MPDIWMDRSRAHSHEHLVIRDDRLGNVLQLQDIRRAVPVLDDCFRGVLLSRTCPSQRDRQGHNRREPEHKRLRSL